MMVSHKLAYYSQKDTDTFIDLEARFERLEAQVAGLTEDSQTPGCWKSDSPGLSPMSPLSLAP